MMDPVRDSLIPGTFAHIPSGLTWSLISYFELEDIIRLAGSCRGARELLASNDFWCFLYYRHLIPSPWYLDIQHASLLEPLSCSWYYMYLEEYWVQCTSFHLSPLLLCLLSPMASILTSV